MPEATDFQLLQEYAGKGSDAAFKTLVDRHLNLVYSVAFSRLGNEAAARDISQIVFAALSRKGGRLSERVVLSGWLFQVTVHTCQDLQRAESRRKKWENEAVQQQITESNPAGPEFTDAAPVISEALSTLAKAERDAILLRFFEDRDFRQVGAQLGISEAAAKMRVARGLARLRLLLQKRGITFSEATLCGALPRMMQCAPAGLGAAIKTGVAAQAVLSASNIALLKGVLNTMALTKLKAGVAGAIIVASVVTPFIVQHQAQATLAALDASLVHQGVQLADNEAENKRIANLAAATSLNQTQLNDLERLRGEVAALRAQTGDIPKLQEENRRLQASLDKPLTPMQQKEQAMAKLSYGKNWTIAFYQFAEKNGGRFPTNFSDAASFLSAEAQKETRFTADQFEITFVGSPSTLDAPQNTILLREKEPWNAGQTSNPPGKWAKTYVFADGHSEVHLETENNFDDYEKAHIAAPQADNQ